MRHSLWDSRNEISAVLADPGSTKRAGVTEIFEFSMAKVHDNFKAKVIETVVETFEDVIQTSYSSSNEGHKSVMFRVMEHDFTELIQPSRVFFFEEIQCARVAQSESIVEQIAKSVLSSTTFIVPKANIV